MSIRNRIRITPFTRSVHCGVGYFGLALISMAISRRPEMLGGFWLPNAWLAACLTLAPRAEWLRLCLLASVANILANAAFGGAWSSALPYIPANLLQAVLAAWLLNSSKRSLHSDRDPIAMVYAQLSGSVLPALVAAFLGAALLQASRGGTYTDLWLKWFGGAMLGAVAALPLFLLMARDGSTVVLRRLARPGFMLMLVCAMLLQYISFNTMRYTFVPVLAATLVAMVYLSFEECAALALSGFVSLYAMVALGWIGLPEPGHHYQQFELLLTITLYCFIPLFVSAALAQSRERQRALKSALETSVENAHRLNTVFETMAEGIILRNARMEVVAHNAKTLEILALSAPELMGATTMGPEFKPVHPDGSPFLPEEYPAAVALRTGQAQRNIVMGFTRHDGTQRWIRINAQIICDPVRNERYSYVTLSDITNERSAASALETVNAYLHGLLENSADAILTVDARQTIINANPAAHAIFGHAPGTLAGQELDVLIPSTLRSHHAQQVNAFAQDARDSRRMGAREQVSGLRQGGETFPLEVTLAKVALPEATYFMAICRDVTQQQQAAQAMREREAQYQRAVAGSADGIWDWNLLTDETYLSPRWKEMLGFANDELPNHAESFFDRVHPEDQERVHAEVEAHLTQGAPYETQLRLRCKNGEYRWFYTRGVRFTDAQGRNIFMSGSTTDITERKQVGLELDAHRHHLEELVAHRTRELQAATLAAQEATWAKSAFLANMSHEIRTPLNAVIGFTHLLHDEEASPLQRERLTKIDRAAHQLLSLVSDLLDFSKLEAGKVDLYPEIFEVQELLTYASNLVEQHLQRKAVELVIQCDPAVPKYLHGDRLRLGQIVGNFANNAGKFTEYGHIILGLHLRHTTEQHVGLRFEVKDTGIGLSPQQIERLFQPFVQADANITRRFGGTGLGLAMCAKLAHAMGGKVGVDSVLDQGSTFWFEVELEKLAENFALPATTATQPHALLGHVLVADDAQFNQELAHDLLTRLGLVVDIAFDGRQAVQMCQRKVYDLVLMDMQMPVSDGITATQELRAQAAFQDLPIVAMTANATPADAERCKAAGMNGFLTKPLNIELLYATLARFLPTGRAPGAEPAAASAPPLLGPLARGLATLEDMDVERPLATCGGNVEQLERILTVCLRTYSETPQEMQLYMAARQWSDAQRLAHTVKSMAATLGADTLSTLAAQVEQTLKDQHPDLAPVEAFLAQLQQLLDTLHHAREDSSAHAQATSARTGTAQHITASDWENLDAWLDIDDTRAMHWVHQHQQALNQLAEVHSGIGPLLLHIHNFDFAHARHALRHLDVLPTTSPP